MVHGDCSSRGCYAMTDEQIAEIYSLGRESFFGGQKSFQLQAYPFQMTPVNMAKHRNNPNMPFWKMIKEGNDHFEVTRQEPKVDFCEKKYVFDAIKAPNATRELVFDASAKCPAYAIPDEIADAVREKQAARTIAETAELIAQGNAGGADQYRHRRRHEQGVRRRACPKATPACREAGDGPGLSLLALSRARAPFRPTSIRRKRRAVRQSAAWARRNRRSSPRRAGAALPLPAADARRQCGAVRAENDGVSVLQPRPQGRHRRRRDRPPPQHGTRRRREAEGDRGQAARAAAAQRPEAAAPKPARTEARRRQARPRLKPSVTDAPAQGRSLTVPSAGSPASAPIASRELVRQPILAAR